MDKMIQKSSKRQRHWGVESHTDKHLITSLGAISFSKTLSTNKETGESEYFIDSVLGF